MFLAGAKGRNSVWPCIGENGGNQAVNSSDNGDELTRERSRLMVCLAVYCTTELTKRGMPDQRHATSFV